MNSKEFDSLAPGMWLTHAGKTYKITAQQNFAATYFQLTEMEYDKTSDEWLEGHEVYMNRYFLIGWEVFYPNEEKSE